MILKEISCVQLSFELGLSVQVALKGLQIYTRSMKLVKYVCMR